MLIGVTSLLEFGVSPLVPFLFDKSLSLTMEADRFPFSPLPLSFFVDIEPDVTETDFFIPPGNPSDIFIGTGSIGSDKSNTGSSSSTTYFN